MVISNESHPPTTTHTHTESKEKSDEYQGERSKFFVTIIVSTQVRICLYFTWQYFFYKKGALICALMAMQISGLICVPMVQTWLKKWEDFWKIHDKSRLYIWHKNIKNL